MDISKYASILINGGIIAFPTETVYGFGVIFDDEKAYEKLINIKRRPPEKPFTLMCEKTSDIEKYGYVNDDIKKIINKFMPGQLTIILKAKPGLPPFVVSKDNTVGIRISSHPIVQSLIHQVGKPLLVPSANRSGEPPLINYQDVKNQFENELDGIIEGKTTTNVPSTVVSLIDKICVLREGNIKLDDINKCLTDEL